MRLARVMCATVFISLLSTCAIAAAEATQAASLESSAPVASASFDKADAHPLVPRDFADNADSFHFAIVADRTGGLQAGVFEDALRKLNILQPGFVMSVGDVMDGYEEDPALVEKQWDEFDAMVSKLDMPFFPITGNHEAMNELLVKKWGEHFGPLWYHFVYKNVLFLCLDSQDVTPITPGGRPTGFSDKQIDYVDKTLAANPDVRWTFVFMHQPVWSREDYKEPTGWEKIEALLANRPHTVFAGHFHGYAKYDVGGRLCYRLATTGGASQLDAPGSGQFDEVVWITMTDKGPAMANLLLDGILDDDVVTSKSDALYGLIFSAPAVHASSIVTDKSIFESESLPLQLKNDADIPLAVKVAFRDNPQVRLEPCAVERTLAPKSTETVSVKMTAVRPVEASLLVPVEMNWSATYDVPGEKAVAAKGSQAVIVEPIHDCLSVARPVTVDGSLDEWPQLPLVCRDPMQVEMDRKSWTGPDDASLRFAVAYDEQFLYVAVESADDSITIGPDRTPRQEDGVGIYLDARSQAEIESTEKASPLLIIVSPSGKPLEPVIADKDKLPEGVRAACAIGPHGFTTEVAIPTRYLDQMQGKPWDTFRLNIRQQDFDGGQWQRAYIYWRPRWDQNGNFPLSGTFKRN